MVLMNVVTFGGTCDALAQIRWSESIRIYITDNNKIDGKKYDMIGPVGHLLGDPNHIELAR